MNILTYECIFETTYVSKKNSDLIYLNTLTAELMQPVFKI